MEQHHQEAGRSKLPARAFRGAVQTPGLGADRRAVAKTISVSFRFSMCTVKDPEDR